MRGLGWGETQVIESFVEAATGFKSETVRLNACLALANCLGLTKEVQESPASVKIVINPSRVFGEPESGQLQPAKVENGQPKSLGGGAARPVQITR